MNDLWATVCGNGLYDGLNPCMFMTCAVFITQRSWLKKRSVRMGLLGVVFGLTYAASSLSFNFGPAQILLFNKKFIFMAKVLYLMLGIGSFILGILSFKDWMTVRNDGAVVPGFLVQPGFKKYMFTVIVSLVLSALATLWPINNYILILGNVSFLKGQWQMTMPLLLNYTLISMWPLWFVWAFLSIKDLRLSLIKIVSAAIYFTGASSIIFIFKGAI